ncbi:hypothetical protein J6590_031419 [Homalodisca vitripennis]|nr:hypothetical protein J6590_031419 [Homalodisca vitripennis]
MIESEVEMCARTSPSKRLLQLDGCVWQAALSSLISNTQKGAMGGVLCSDLAVTCLLCLCVWMRGLTERKKNSDVAWLVGCVVAIYTLPVSRTLPPPPAPAPCRLPVGHSFATVFQF